MLKWLTINSGRLLTANFTQLWHRFTDFRRRKLSHNVRRRNFRTPKIRKNYYYYVLVIVPGMATEFWYRFNYLNSHELPSSTSFAIAKLPTWVFI